jgi:hypothetical protein
VTLRSTAGTDDAIGRWLEPELCYQPVETVSTNKIGANLKVTAEHSSQTTEQSKEIYLEALYAGRSTPTWSFTRTRTSEIRGQHALRMLVEHDQDSRVTASIEIGATIRVQKLGVFSYKAELPASVTELFVFG